MTPRETARPLTTSVDRTRLLIADLEDLAIDLAESSYSQTTIEMVQRNLKRSVGSALGASVAVPAAEGREGASLNLIGKTVQPGEVASTLSVPLRHFRSGLDGDITFYASAPHAFSRLASDLAEALGLFPSALDQRPQRPVEPLHPAVRGLQDLAVINEAVGILVGRGLRLDRARAEMRRRADLAGTGLLAAAHEIRDSYC